MRQANVYEGLYYLASNGNAQKLIRRVVQQLLTTRRIKSGSFIID